MADKPLFILNAEGRWRLAYDRQQWAVQRRAGKPCRRGSDSAAMRRTGWKGVSFIGDKKATLRRVLGEKGIILTAEARARFDELPTQFVIFLAGIDKSAPGNARTAQFHPLHGPERPPGPERPSMAVVGAQASEAA